MCGWAARSVPFAGQLRQAEAFSWAMPRSATRPSPPACPAASMSGRAIAALFSPLAKRTTGISWASAQRWSSATYASPIRPNAAELGMR